MKENEEMHLKSTINESTLSTADAVPLPQGGRLRYEDEDHSTSFFTAMGIHPPPSARPFFKGLLSCHAKAPSATDKDYKMRIPLPPHQSLPRVGKVASAASRIGF